MKNDKKARKISPKDKFSLQRAAMILGISRDTLRRRLFDSGTPVEAGREYTRDEILGALWGTKHAACTLRLNDWLPDGTKVTEQA